MTVGPVLGSVAEEGGGKLGEAALQELLTAGDEGKEQELGLFMTQ